MTADFILETAFMRRQWSDREHLGLARTLDLDNYAAETLYALLVTLDDFVGYGDRVTGLERRYIGIRLCPHLLVDELDDCVFVHCCNKFNVFRAFEGPITGMFFSASSFLK